MWLNEEQAEDEKKTEGYCESYRSGNKGDGASGFVRLGSDNGK